MGETFPRLSRRALVGGLASFGGLAIVGCSRSPQSRQAQGNDATAGQQAPQLASMTVYRDPSCGCCEAWAGIARQAGYKVQVVDHPDMPAIKRRYGVPDELLSCHTTVVGNYAVEGHVPLEDVKQLLETMPAELKGIAVAGMPVGSPGMEVPDGTRQPFQVMAFDGGGRVSVFRA